MQVKLEAKRALNKVIGIARVHFYKPFQIAEILYHYRIGDLKDLEDLESYRNISKKWRDYISMRLVGRVSTSSQKYQDNVFENNATPPRLLTVLGDINNEGDGFIEAYIYKSFQLKMSKLYQALNYVKSKDPALFSLKALFSLFTEESGLRRSIDKTYEIAVYALFSTLVRALKAEVTLEIKNEDKEVLGDFETFIKIVLGIDADNTKITIPADLYRVGVTNAADRGLDMWTNFGAAVQVKHLTLTVEDLDDICEGIRADRVIVVCIDAERKPIENLLNQVGLGHKLQGIITIDDLDNWYNLCLSDKYLNKLGKTLLSDLEREFILEFPSADNLTVFLHERGYETTELPEEWEIS